jgi:hypothetical protein
MIRSKGIIRPPFPVRINYDSPEAIGLLAWFPMQFGATVRDWFMPSTEAPVINSANLFPTNYGWGLDSFSANDTGARMTTPAYLKGLSVITLVSTFMKVGTSSNNSEIFGISHTSTDTSPFVLYGIGFSATAALRGEFSSGIFLETLSSVTPANFVLNQVVFCLQNSEQKLYQNGVQIASGASVFSGGSADAGSRLMFGINVVNLTRNPNIVTYDNRIYNRFFQESDVANMWNNGNPWGLYQQLRQPFKVMNTPTVTPSPGVGPATGSFVASPVFTG